jgi:hypothetical protein
MRRVLFVSLVASVAVVMAAIPALASRVVIHEIYYNSPGSDDGSNKSLNGEWVQLCNTSTTDLHLTGWTVNDAVKHTYKFGTYTLKAKTCVKIHTGSGTNTQTDRYWGSKAYIWNNDKDTATLKDAKGSVLDTCSYNDPSHSYKIC